MLHYSKYIRYSPRYIRKEFLQGLSISIVFGMFFAASIFFGLSN